MNRAAAEALFNEQVAHLEGDLLVVRAWTVFSRAFPILDVGFAQDGRSPFRLRMMCDDWNDLPPSMMLQSFDGVPLQQEKVPSGPTNVFHRGPHDATRLPFICMAGSREYHTHSNHLGDPWSNYKTRSGYDLGGLMTQVWSAWLKSSS